MTMSGTQKVGLALVAVLAIVVAILLIRGSGEGDPADPGAEPSPTSSLPVVDDDVWCAGWLDLVAAQGQYVASPTPETTMTLLAVVDDLQSLGVPESLDPSGYTELTAVLDDVRGSADPTFTPTIAPSEPADVSIEDDEHEDDEHEDDEHGDDEHGGHGATAEEAPFGAWLAEYCAI